MKTGCFSPEENAALIEGANANISSREIAEQLHRTWRSVKRRREQLVIDGRIPRKVNGRKVVHGRYAQAVSSDGINMIKSPWVADDGTLVRTVRAL